MSLTHRRSTLSTVFENVLETAVVACALCLILLRLVRQDFILRAPQATQAQFDS
eukprot:SAG31_NODE_23629_length_500_cov_0.770574_1_plen_53_part_01